MPISRPRRIFRPALAPLIIKGIAAVLVVCLLGAGGFALTTLSWQMPGSAAASHQPTDQLDAQPSQVAVVDGSTLRLENRVVRLLGVDAPQRGATCTARDGTGFDCGAAATNALAALVREVPVACQLRGHDELGRPYGVCQASGTELNSAVVEAGWARADAALPALKTAETSARAARRGLWATDRTASW